MRIATYHVENLFSWAKALNSDDPANTMELQNVAELQKLIEQPAYSDADKKRILELLATDKALGESEPFLLRETRQRLVSNGKIVGDRRVDWVDWIEWQHDLISAAAIKRASRHHSIRILFMRPWLNKQLAGASRSSCAAPITLSVACSLREKR
jgi:hypothetical protein